MSFCNKILLFIIPFYFFTASTSLAAIQGCVEKLEKVNSDFKQIDPIDLKARLEPLFVKTFFCRVNDAANEKIFKVSYMRLSELLAGNFVVDEKLELSRLSTKKYSIVRNEVYEEAHYLFESFGLNFKTRQPMLKQINDKTGYFTEDFEEFIVERDAGALEALEEKSYWLLTDPMPEDPYLKGSEVYLKTVNKEIFDTKRWPREFHQFDACDGPSQKIQATGYNEKKSEKSNDYDLFNCLTIWKYLKLSDLLTIEKESKELFSDGSDAIIERDHDLVSGSLDPRAVARNFSLFRYLGKENWPDDFLYLQGNGFGSLLPECGGHLSLEYFARPMSLDILVVENLSLSTLQLDQLIGSVSLEKKLRQNQLSDGSNELLVDPILVESQSSAIIPLRITFGEVPVSFPSSDGGVALYNWIKDQPKRKFFEINNFDDHQDWDFPRLKIMKTSESFAAPLVPSPEKLYVYGPEYKISGASIGKSVVRFQDTNANLLAVTAATAGASCPYFYSWNAKLGRWFGYGKILAEAAGAENIQSEFIQVEPGTTRVAIFEEEMEVSHIDKVQMVLKLLNGKKVVIKPNSKRLAAADREFLTILPFQGAVIEFDWPSSLREADVLSSKVEVFGYYKRSVFAAK